MVDYNITIIALVVLALTVAQADNVSVDFHGTIVSGNRSEQVNGSATLRRSDSGAELRLMCRFGDAEGTWKLQMRSDGTATFTRPGGQSSTDEVPPGYLDRKDAAGILPWLAQGLGMNVSGLSVTEGEADEQSRTVIIRDEQGRTVLELVISDAAAGREAVSSFKMFFSEDHWGDVRFLRIAVS